MVLVIYRLLSKHFHCDDFVPQVSFTKAISFPVLSHEELIMSFII